MILVPDVRGLPHPGEMANPGTMKLGISPCRSLMPLCRNREWATHMPLPIFPLNAVLFPGLPLPLRIFEDRYLRMLADHASVDPVFGIALIESGREVGDEPEFHHIGTTARLVSLNAQSAHRVDVVVVGERRIRMGPGDWKRGYAVSEVEFIADQSEESDEMGTLVATAGNAYQTYLRGVAHLIGMDYEPPDFGTDGASVSYEIGARLPLHTWEQQALLEDSSPLSRMRTVVNLLEREVALLYRSGMVGVPIQFPGNRFTLN